MARIVGDEGGPKREGMGCDHRVERPDLAATGYERSSQASITSRGVLIERSDRDPCDESIDESMQTPGVAPRRAIAELRCCDRTDREFTRPVLPKARGDVTLPSKREADRVGVE